MTMPVVLPLIRAVAVALLVIACSGDKPAPSVASDAGGSRNEARAAQQPAAPTDRACELLTKSEAATLLTSSIKTVGDESAPQPMGTMLRSSCFYRSDNGGTVQLTLDKHGDAAVSQEKFDRLVRRYRGGREVAGIGDAAFVHDNVLLIRRGDAHLMIQLNPGGDRKIKSYSDQAEMDAILADERTVAERALQRLPAPGSAVAVRSPAMSDRSACALVTKDEMERMLGGELAHAVPSDSPAKTTCTYTGAGGRYARIEIEWKGGESGMAGAKLAGSLMQGQADPRIKVASPIEGLGDEAMMVMGGVLNVRKGEALISVDVRRRDAEQKLREIAEKILAVLPAV